MFSTKSMFCLIVALLLREASPLPECNFFRNDMEGFLEIPDDEATLSCKWTVVPAENYSKLLVSVKMAALPPNVELIVYTDDDEFNIVPNCYRCVKNLVTSTLKVLLNRLTYRRHDITVTHSTAFKIHFRSFDPGHCFPFKHLKNGMIIGNSYVVGKSVLFVCHPPYYRVGKSKAKCLQTKSVIPKWSVDSIKCEIPRCNSGPIRIISTTVGSSVANPGYGGSHLLPQQSCWWDISPSRNDQQIRASFQYIDIFGDKDDNVTSLRLYDGSLNKLLIDVTFENRNATTIVTTTDRLIVIFYTGKIIPQSAPSGFLLNFSSVSVSCVRPKIPVDGEMEPMLKSYAFNALLLFRCNDGYYLNGTKQLTCLLNGRWNGSVPRCLAKNSTFVKSDYPSCGKVNQDSNVKYDSVNDKSSIKDSSSKPSATKIKIKSKKKNKKKLELELAKPVKNISEKPDKSRSRPKVNETLTRKPTKNISEKPDKSHSSPKVNNTLTRRKPPDKSHKADGHPNVNTRPEYPQKNRSTSIMRKVVASSGDGPSVESNVDHEGNYLQSSDRQNSMDGFVDADVTLIVIATCVPVLLIVIIVTAVVVYRRVYPVRMGIGRKFSTFENPMYEKKRSPNKLVPEAEKLNC